jgi:hypothetical protein
VVGSLQGGGPEDRAVKLTAVDGRCQSTSSLEGTLAPWRDILFAP